MRRANYELTGNEFHDPISDLGEFVIQKSFFQSVLMIV